MAKYKNTTNGWLILGNFRLEPQGEFDTENITVKISEEHINHALKHGFLQVLDKKSKQIKENKKSVEQENSIQYVTYTADVADKAQDTVLEEEKYDSFLDDIEEHNKPKIVKRKKSKLFEE